MEEIIIRDLIPDDDFAFVIDSWLRSYYLHTYPQKPHMPKAVFFAARAKIIKQLLIEATTLLAVKSDDPNIIVAYICFDKKENTIHYVYVKESFRGFGICRQLLLSQGFFDGTRVTHLTTKGRKILLSMNYSYSPYSE